MKHTSTGGRILAIVAGIAFTYGGLRIILGDTLTDPSLWTTSVQLTVLMVLGTIAAGHLMRDAAMAKRFTASFGFLVLFLAGTGLVVFNSVGRQAEVSMLTASQADDIAERRVGIRAALSRAEAMLADAQANLVKECRTGRGPRCQGIEATIGVYEAAIKGHHADLERVGPPKPANAKAAHMAKIMALTGADEGRAKAALMLLEPFLWTLFFEIGSIVSLGFAFGRRTLAKAEPSDVSGQTSFGASDAEVAAPTATIRPDRPAGGASVRLKPDRPKPSAPAVSDGRTEDRRGKVLAFVQTEQALGRTIPRQADIAERFDVPRSTLSDWCREWEADGSIPARRAVGRCKVIAAG